MGIRHVAPGIPRVEDRRDPPDRPKPGRPFPSVGEDDDPNEDAEPGARDPKSSHADPADEDPDPERLVDIRVAPWLAGRQNPPTPPPASAFP